MTKTLLHGTNSPCDVYSAVINQHVPANSQNNRAGDTFLVLEISYKYKYRSVAATCKKTLVLCAILVVVHRYYRQLSFACSNAETIE